MANPKPFKILALGSPVLDISLKVTLPFLQKHNINKAQALITNNPNHPFIQELLNHKDSMTTCGGSILNTLRVLSWGLKNHPQFQCTMASGFIKDPLGMKIMEYLEKENVGNIFEYYEGFETARCGCAIYEKDRSMICFIGDVQKYSDKHFETNFSQFEESDFFMVEGYYVSADFPKIKRIIDSLKAQRKPVACSLSSPFILKTFPAEMKYIVENSDMVFGNKEEAYTFISTQGYDTSDDFNVVLDIIATKFTNPNSDTKLIVITNDHKAISVLDFDYKTNLPIFQKIVPIPQKITFDEIEDKNGAGDSFMGGYLAAHFLGKSYLECIEAGNIAAVNILKRVGCNIDWENNLF